MNLLLHEVKHRPQLAMEAGFKVENLATICGMNVRCLERRFLLEERLTPRLWLRLVRLRAGLSKLLAGKSVKLTAYELGYRNPCHFSRAFRAFFGVSAHEIVALVKACVSRSGSSFAVRAILVGAVMLQQSQTNERVKAL